MTRYHVVLLAGTDPKGMALSLLSEHSSLQAASTAARKAAGQLRDREPFSRVALRQLEGNEDAGWRLVAAKVVAPGRASRKP